ncbi:serine/threonine protein kinase [Nocardiopsis sp. Huas11]|uniref:serine/threonine-protein kinase n=1 Tax=Nocardiopsis sp. Huas11 TaxID=2183912 RepID=UPI000EB428E9|nr:serine/threonine-protein kinase [Nocardiopsis sp. Huas11]RKS05528.1 serine/threonine protein kinase [Nocardiopsis sp. Huas11]
MNVVSPAASPEGASPLASGDPRHLGPFRLAGRLGSGGMGVVYAALDDRDHPAAVKCVHGIYATDAEFRARFAREVDLASRVRAACVPRFLGADTAADVPWLATEYVPGRTLGRHVRERGPLTGAAVAAFAMGVAEALTAIHAQGVVHRDLKPGNVILAPDGPKVLDFGIARAVEETALTHTGGLVGTPGWIAPEQYRGASAMDRSDVFAWAGLVAFAATGRGPFGEGTSDVLASRIISEPPSLEGVPLGLRDLLERALDKDPERRPTARALWEELIRRLAPAGAPVTDPSALMRTAWTGVADPVDGRPAWAAHAAPRRPWVVRRRRPLSIVGGALALALVAGTGAAVLLREEEPQGGTGGGTGQTAEEVAADGVPEEYAELYETGEVRVDPVAADEELSLVRVLAPAEGGTGGEGLEQLRLTFLDAQETGSEANAMELTVRAEYLPDFGDLRLHSNDFAFVTVTGVPEASDLQRPSSTGVLATLSPQDPVAEFEMTYIQTDRNAPINNPYTQGVAFYLPGDAVPEDGPAVPESLGGVCSENNGQSLVFRLSAYDPVAATGVPVDGCDFTIPIE